MRRAVRANSRLSTVSFALQHKFQQPSYIPLSVYCLAISATASPILFRTWLTCSVARLRSICCLIATLASLLREKKRSLDSFVSGFFLDFDACFLKRTAANERAWTVIRFMTSVLTCTPYRYVLGAIYLLHQAHEQDIWAIDHPVIGEVFFCLRPYIIVRG